MIRLREIMGIFRLVAICLLAGIASPGLADDHNYVPARGLVPDEATAVAIAEAVLIPIYGQSRIAAQRPFATTLDNGQWTVIGQLKSGQAGGVGVVVIDKTTGQIVRVTHGR
jgi:NTF2 fold immunity protein